MSHESALFASLNAAEKAAENTQHDRNAARRAWEKSNSPADLLALQVAIAAANNARAIAHDAHDALGCHAIESECRVKRGCRTMVVITEPDRDGLFDTRDLYTGHQEYFRADEVEHACFSACR